MKQGIFKAFKIILAIVVVVIAVKTYSHYTQPKKRSDTFLITDRTKEIKDKPLKSNSRKIDNSASWDNWKLRFDNFKEIGSEWSGLMFKNNNYEVSYTVEQNSATITHIIDSSGKEIKRKRFIGSKPQAESNKINRVNGEYDVKLIRGNDGNYNFGITEKGFPRRKFVVQNLTDTEKMKVSTWINQSEMYKLNDWIILCTNRKDGTILINLETQKGNIVNSGFTTNIYTSKYPNIFYIESTVGENLNGANRMYSIDINNLDKPIRKTFFQNSRCQFYLCFRNVLDVVEGDNTINILWKNVEKKSNGNKGTGKNMVLEVYNLSGDYLGNKTFQNVSSLNKSQMIYSPENKRISVLVPHYEFNKSFYTLYSFESNDRKDYKNF